MNIYIAYKYTHVKDKESLKLNLERISNIFTDMGHKTFILGRDKKNWSSIKAPLRETIPEICKNVRKSDMLVGYIVGNEKSPGLAFELIYSRLLNKPVTLIIKGNNVNCPLGKRLAKTLIHIDNIDEIKEKFSKETQ